MACVVSPSQKDKSMEDYKSCATLYLSFISTEASSPTMHNRLPRPRLVHSGHCLRRRGDIGSISHGVHFSPSADIV